MISTFIVTTETKTPHKSANNAPFLLNCLTNMQYLLKTLLISDTTSLLFVFQSL